MQSKNILIQENKKKIMEEICYKCGSNFLCGGFETLENCKKSYVGEEEARICCNDCEQTKKDIEAGRLIKNANK